MTTASRGTRIVGLAAVLGLIATVALGLTLPMTEEQREYARLIAIHPALAWSAYLAFAMTALGSALYLWKATRSPLWDHLAAASAEVGVVFTALTLVTGSIWGRATWGVWWAWDARLTLTALMGVLFLGYLALRRVPSAPEVRARRAAIVGLLSTLVVPVNHFAVQWWRTLHQRESLTSTGVDGRFKIAMLVGFVSMTLTYSWLVIHRLRLERLTERLEAEGLDAAIAERRAEAEVVA